MYANRNKGRVNPAGAGAALAVSAAMFAALVNMTPDFIDKFIDKPLVTENIPLPPDPPPPPKPQPKTDKVVDKPTIETKLVVPPVKIDTKLATNVEVVTTNNTDVKVDPTPGGTGTGLPLDPPKPLPVMTGAEPIKGADFQPEYPADMRRLGMEGQVIVRVLIGVDGRVKQIELIKSPSDSFFNATRRQALSKWRFKPATVDGVAVEKWRQMTLRFSLTDA